MQSLYPHLLLVQKVFVPAPAAGAEGVGRCCVSEYIMPYIRTATQATHALKESLYRH